MHADDSMVIARRGLMMGAGAAALLVGAASMPPAAEAAPPKTKLMSVREREQAKIHADDFTVSASAPRSGFVYRGLQYVDFSLLYDGSTRSRDNYGAYCHGATNFLLASVELPAGTLLGDVEFYVYNNSGQPTPIDAGVVQPGGAYSFNAGLSGSVPSTGSLSATRLVATGFRGPYPPGSVLYLELRCGPDTNIQLTGARVGLQQGAAQIGLLPAPVRVYDSRSAGDGSRFTAGSTRTITIPSASLPAGATGAIINVAAVDATAKGLLKVWPADQPEPAASALNFNAAGDTFANEITVGVALGGLIKVKASQPVHVVVDLSGYLA